MHDKMPFEKNNNKNENVTLVASDSCEYPVLELLIELLREPRTFNWTQAQLREAEKKVIFCDPTTKRAEEGGGLKAAPLRKYNFF